MKCPISRNDVVNGAVVVMLTTLKNLKKSRDVSLQMSTLKEEKKIRATRLRAAHSGG